MKADFLVDHRSGIRIAGLSVFLLSFDGLLVRLASADAASVAFWRGAFIGLTILTYMTLSGRLAEFKVYRAAGLGAAVVTLVYSISTVLFVFSVSYTNVANTVVILSSSAFFAALFSWFILKETVPLKTWIAISVALLGVLVVFAGSFGLGNWLGDFIAILLAMMMGLSLTLLRRLPKLPQMPIIVIGGLTAALLMLPFSQAFNLKPASYGWLAVMGVIQMPLASVLLMKATKYLPSPEVSLFLLIETVLSPIWVWLVLNESVPPLTLVGGSAILGAVFLHSWLALKNSRGRVKVIS